MLIYGHRGTSASEPENTLRSFRRALEIGVDGLEFDVQATADRVPVILHDRDLRRTTNSTGPIDHRAHSDLQEIDAGHGERVPALAEVLDLVGGRVHLDIEIKQGGVEREVLDVLAQFPQTRWAISSFDWTMLERIRELSSVAEIWLLAVVVSDALFETARRLGACGVSLYASALTEQTSPRLRDAGLDIIVWTINDPAEATRVQALGATGLCTDAPDKIIAHLSQIPSIS